MHRFTLATFLFCAVPTAQAADNYVTVPLHPSPLAVDALLPASDIQTEEGEYGAILMAAFPQAFAPNVRARAVEIEPFTGSETIMALTVDGRRYRISEATSTRWLWSYTQTGREQAEQFHQKLRPANFHNVKLNRCSAVLEKATGDRVLTLWTQVLQRARYYKVDPPPADAGWVYFTVNVGNTNLTAVDHGYEQGPTVSAFEQLTRTLSDLCNGKSSIASVNAATAALSKLLTAKKVP